MRGCSLSHPRVTPFVLPEQSLAGMCAALMVLDLPCLNSGRLHGQSLPLDIFHAWYSQADTRPP